MKMIECMNKAIYLKNKVCIVFRIIKSRHSGGKKRVKGIYSFTTRTAAVPDVLRSGRNEEPYVRHGKCSFR